MGEKEIQNIKVACILDIDSYTFLKYECNLLELHGCSWLTELEQENPDVLLVESAWQAGVRVENIEQAGDRTLSEIVEWCRKKGIPAVFWNNEDPVYFDRFIAAAKLFDYIFTIDADMIPRYKEITGHDRVHLLMFAAQPKLHNPMEKDRERLGKVAFAGNLSGTHIEPMNDPELLLGPALSYGVHIYDSMAACTNKYPYPQKCRAFIKECVPCDQMSAIYKKYDVFLDSSTSMTSSTAVQKRIFELLACGLNVISSYSPALEKIFPEIVKVCRTSEDAAIWLSALLGDKVQRDKLSVLGQREIFSKHTYRHRLQTILDTVGIRYEKEKPAGVSIITCTNKQKYMENVFTNFERQKYAPKELVVVLNSRDMDISAWQERAARYDSVRVFQQDDEITLWSCMNFGVEQAEYAYIAKFDDDDYYAPEFLSDLMNVFVFSDADITGKFPFFTYFEELRQLFVTGLTRQNRYFPYVAGSTMVVRKTIFDRVKFSDLPAAGDVDFYKRCEKEGILMYSSDRFNYSYFKHPSTDSHTWKIDTEGLMKISRSVAVTDNFQKHINV